MAQRSKRMRNKKTQKQGRSKRGGVGFNTLFALVPALLFSSAIVKQANQAGKQLTNPMEGFKIQILTREDVIKLIKPETLESEQLQKINKILPIQQVVVGEDGKVMSGVTQEEDMPKQFAIFTDVTPDMFRDMNIDGFNAWPSGYGARESMVPYKMEDMAFFEGGLIVAVPPYVTLTPDNVEQTKNTIKNAMLASVENMFDTNGLEARPSFEMLPDAGGGSRKNRPKTRRRSKRY